MYTCTCVSSQSKVFQFRHDGNDSFLRDWDDYRLGFTSPHGSILWLGNENLHRLTSSGSWVLGVLLVDWADEARSSFYWNFRVSDESQGYRLNIDSYLSIDGDAGDSLSMHNGAKFSTWDKDNDVSDVNCASLYSGGWWFTDCLDSNLNGEYFGTGNHTSALTNQGIIWSSWKGRHYSVRQTMMFLINNGSEVFV
ncbi:ficolin-1-like [Acanthaster planci]|uniref:Ficolin-1-like n=1 Tax=Acanthaster planci TaxID=133434 RepID=A0A8B7XN74_ACAPL|nr:ficolin-1-like [Acanthaster planci]